MVLLIYFIHCFLVFKHYFQTYREEFPQIVTWTTPLPQESQTSLDILNKKNYFFLSFIFLPTFNSFLCFC